VKIPNIAGMWNVGKAVMAAHRPEILLGTSLVSTVAGMVAAARAGYKSGQQVMTKELNDGVTLSVKEKAQLTWINYLPSAGIGFAALGATTGLHIVHVKEKKALAAAALMAIEEVKKEANQYVADVREAVSENVTEKKADAIDDAILQKTADRNNGVAFVQDSDGTIVDLYLVRDAKTGRDVWSNESRIEEALLRCNELLMSEGSCDLNTFYSFAGFNTIPEGDASGWSGERISVSWDLTQRDDGRPVKAFTFRPAPVAARG
jgi:hypothetical protein